MCLFPQKVYDMQVPCGTCIECAQQKANEWAFRVMLELKQHNNIGCFITLTFNDEHLGDNNLDKSDLQKFFKRLRKRHEKESDFNIKYLACGEYGTRRGRKHYHAVIVGYDFSDTLYKVNEHIHSTELDELWKFGFSDVQEIEFNLVRYVCKYLQKFQWSSKNYSVSLCGSEIIKMQNTPKDDIFNENKPREFYFDYEFGKSAPFFLCSKGIGYEEWLKKPDFYSGKIYYNGNYIKIPRYFIQKFCNEHDEPYEEYMSERRQKAHENIKTDEEIRTHREFVRAKMLKRR